MDEVYIMRNFVAAIINKALFDWQFPNRRNEIREFFQTEWGKELCEIIDLPAEEILRKLEKGEINLKYFEEVA